MGKKRRRKGKDVFKGVSAVEDELDPQRSKRRGRKKGMTLFKISHKQSEDKENAPKKREVKAERKNREQLKKRGRPRKKPLPEEPEETATREVESSSSSSEEEVQVVK